MKYHLPECEADKRGYLTFRQAQHYAALARLSLGGIGCILHFGIGRELSRQSFQFRADRSGERLAAASIWTAHHPDGLDDSRLSEDSASVGGPPEAEDDERRQLPFDIFDRTGLRCRLDSLYRSNLFIDPAAGECDGVATGAVSSDVRAGFFGAIPAGFLFHRKAQIHFFSEFDQGPVVQTFDCTFAFPHDLTNFFIRKLINKLQNQQFLTIRCQVMYHPQ